jgi:hypothetical protein
MHNYWLKQELNRPLYPDMIWSRPENRNLAGKLLVLGGSAQGFSAAATAYNEAIKAGVGAARVLLPDALQKTVGRILDNGEFAPSTPSGSFSRLALAELLSLSQWSDMVLLAGDLGRNSETAVMLEQYIQKFDGKLTLTKDAADYFTAIPLAIVDRSNTLLVISMAQLQKLFIATHSTTAITFSMDLIRLIDALHEFTSVHEASIIVKHLDNIIVSVKGNVSTTKLAEDLGVWRVKYAAYASVWWLQNPSKVFEALTTSFIDFN